MLDKLKAIVFATQDSQAGDTNWKDNVHALRLLAVGALLVGTHHLLAGVMKLNFGHADKLIDLALGYLVLKVEAKQADNS